MWLNTAEILRFLFRYLLFKRNKYKPEFQFFKWKSLGIWYHFLIWKKVDFSIKCIFSTLRFVCTISTRLKKNGTLNQDIK